MNERMNNCLDALPCLVMCIPSQNIFLLLRIPVYDLIFNLLTINFHLDTVKVNQHAKHAKHFNDEYFHSIVIADTYRCIQLTNQKLQVVVCKNERQALKDIIEFLWHFQHPQVT